MAQKSNPVSLRLRKTNKLWNSCWYGDFNYTTQLLQDRAVSAYIQNISQQAKMACPVVFLTRQRQRTNTFFFFPRQQRVSRVKRPSRGEFRKTDRPGDGWLHKLLFWSCKVPALLIPAAGHEKVPINNNSAPQPTFTRLPPLLMKQGFHFPFQSSSEFFRLFPYLLFSQAAARLCEKGPARKSKSIFAFRTPLSGEKEKKGKGNAIYYLSPCLRKGLPGSSLVSSAETTFKGQSQCFFQFVISTWKKNGEEKWIRPLSFQSADISRPRPGVAMEKKGPRDWGFFFMRDRYSMGTGISASPSYLDRSAYSATPPGVRWNGPQGPLKRRASSPWRNHLESCISSQIHHNATLYFLLCPSVYQNPFFLAQQLCFSLENRKTFRRLKERLMQDISGSSIIKGVRISCSGRVAARSKKAQKARTESIQWGQTSLNVFSDLVSFASKSALTPFGKIGVKVWICFKKVKRSGVSV